MDTVASLRNLVTFAGRKASMVLSLSVTSPGLLVAPDVTIQRALELRTHQVRIDPADEQAGELLPDDFLFLSPDSSLAFGDLVEEWIGLEDKLGVVLYLFLSLLYNPPLHLENKVMNICQAAEAYHRRTLDHKIMPDREFKALARALKAACPRPHRQWLGDMLSHANTPSFKARIDELVAKADAVGVALASTFKNYSGQLRDYRNDYAHWAQKAPLPQEEVAELVALYDTTRMILEACLLRDLGKTSRKLQQHSRRNATSNRRLHARVSQQARDHNPEGRSRARTASAALRGRSSALPHGNRAPPRARPYGERYPIPALPGCPRPSSRSVLVPVGSACSEAPPA